MSWATSPTLPLCVYWYGQFTGIRALRVRDMVLSSFRPITSSANSYLVLFRRFAPHAVALCPRLFHSLFGLIFELLVVFQLLWSWSTLEHPFQACVPCLLLLPYFLDDAGLSPDKRERTCLETRYMVGGWLGGYCSNCHRHHVQRVSFFLAERGKWRRPRASFKSINEECRIDKLIAILGILDRS